jgi:hypothetical protein
LAGVQGEKSELETGVAALEMTVANCVADRIAINLTIE